MDAEVNDPERFVSVSFDGGQSRVIVPRSAVNENGLAEADRIMDEREQRLAPARAAKAELRADELRRSNDPKDNAAKVKAIQDGTMHSADLYRTIMAGPSGQKGHVFVGRVRYTPNRQEGEFEVIDTSTGERAGWMSRTVRNGEQMYVLYAEDYDGGIHLVGWTDTVSYGADVLVNGSSRASTRGTLDARRLSGGKFEAYVPKSPEEFDRELELREQLVDDLLAREVREAYQRLAESGPPTEEALRNQIRRDFPRGSRGASDTERMIAQLVEQGDIKLDTPRVKRDDDAMTTGLPKTIAEMTPEQRRAVRKEAAVTLQGQLTRMAPAIAADLGIEPEPIIGVKVTSKGRTTTVTLPDGTTATRTSKTRNYTHAVVATRDLHQRAQQIQADTDRRQAFVDALQAWIDRGANTDELKAYPSGSLSYSDEQAGKSRNEYYLPGFEPVRKSVRGGRDYWDDPMQFSLPNFKDTTREGTYVGSGKYTGPELTAWERYGPSHVLGRQRAHIESNQKQAAELNAGPRYAYEVIRWSSSRNLAAQAASSEFSNPWTTYRVIGVGDDLTGQTADEAKPVKVKPTKAELDAAKVARAEQEKADRAKRNEEWTARKVADIKRHLAEGSEQRARSEVISTNDQGLRMIARAFGIKSTPRGMGDRQKTEWLRNAILEAAKKS